MQRASCLRPGTKARSPRYHPNRSLSDPLHRRRLFAMRIPICMRQASDLLLLRGVRPRLPGHLVSCLFSGQLRRELQPAHPCTALNRWRRLPVGIRPAYFPPSSPISKSKLSLLTFLLLSNPTWPQAPHPRTNARFSFQATAHEIPVLYITGMP